MKLLNISGINFENETSEIESERVLQLRHAVTTPINFNQDILRNVYGDLIDKAKNVLEIGCGCGRNASFFINQTKHIKYYGFDTSPTFLRYFKKNNFDINRYYISSDIDETILSQKYDLIFSSYVLQHIGFHSDDNIYDSVKISRVLLPTLKSGGIWMSYELHQGQNGWSPSQWQDQVFGSVQYKVLYNSRVLLDGCGPPQHDLIIIKKMEDLKIMTESKSKDVVEKYKDYLDHKEGFDRILELLDITIKRVSGDYPLLEIGSNMGGSAMCFLDTLKYNNKKNWLYTVDPYGSIPYHNGGFMVESSKYDNKLYAKAMYVISNYCNLNEMNHYHFKVTSDDFIKYVYDNFIQYENGCGNKLDKFSFIFLDGSHDLDFVKRELDFFAKKMVCGGTIVIDDCNSGSERGVIMNDYISSRDYKDLFVVNKFGIKDRYVLERK